jgi:hypothetical protein
MIALTVLLATLSSPVSATTVSLMREGEPVSRGEICRFAAHDPENPFKRWLEAQEVTCVPAGAPIVFPPGAWNVFARTDGAISAASRLVAAGAAPETLTITVQPSAVVIPILADGRTAVVYAPRRVSGFPAGNSGQPVTVPANEELWLIVLEKAKPVALFPIAALEKGSERTVDARGAGPSALLGWLRVPEADRPVLARERGLSPPAIRATLGGPSYDSDPLPPLDLLNGAFVRVRALPAGQAELSVGGRGWVPDRTKATIDAALSIASSPLLVRAGGNVAVHWSAVGDLSALDQSLGACEPPRAPPAFVITLSACPTVPPGELDPSACAPVREENFPPQTTFGIMTAEELAPGTYRAEMRFGKLPPVSATTQVGPLDQKDLRLTGSYLELSGSVTYGDDPFDEDVTIAFPGGGYGFSRAGSGEYRAAVRSLMGIDAQIKVSACDGAPDVTVLTDRPARPFARFNIEVPANELEVRVTDTFTRESLQGAHVKFEVMSLRYPRRPVITRTVAATLNERGDAAAVFRSIPDRELRVTVSHAGYQKQNLEPFSVAKTESKAIDVRLIPLRGNRGRIHAAAPFDSGAVFWYSPRGDEIERAELAADGTFVYASPHEAGETMVVVSLSHPLWIGRSPAVERHQPLELRFPSVPMRTFEVSIPGADRRDQRHVGVVVGGLRIPQPVLRQHQFLRGQAQTIRGSGPIVFRDIAETGPIEALLGPLTTAVSSSVSGSDLFAFPPFDESPRKPLQPGAGSVVFELP